MSSSLESETSAFKWVPSIWGIVLVDVQVLACAKTGGKILKGNILSFDKATNKGKISGFDGARYEFVKQDWESADKTPKVGAEVDFEVDERGGENWAKSILMLGSAEAPTSRTVYILVAIFLGYFGIHNFIAGYKGRGLAQLLITLLSVFIFAIFVWIWAVVEAITVKEDANGQEMT